jgi:hypothetical protein
MVTVVGAVTLFVWTVNRTEEVPAGTVTEAGTVATVGLAVCRLTTHPPDGAGPTRVIVPVAGAPPTTLNGDIENDLMESLLTVRMALLPDVASVAEILAE